MIGIWAFFEHCSEMTLQFGRLLCFTVSTGQLVWQSIKNCCSTCLENKGGKTIVPALKTVPEKWRFPHASSEKFLPKSCRFRFCCLPCSSFSLIFLVEYCWLLSKVKIGHVRPCLSRTVGTGHWLPWLSFVEPVRFPLQIWSYQIGPKPSQMRKASLPGIKAAFAAFP